ncbi:hypothetical protein OA46_22410 [Enterobacter cloacae]|nr:hypothetical protein OA46_22410 [Enterobacter cloacae]
MDRITVFCLLTAGTEKPRLDPEPEGLAGPGCNADLQLLNYLARCKFCFITENPHAARWVFILNTNT